MELRVCFFCEKVQFNTTFTIYWNCMPFAYQNDRIFFALNHQNRRWQKHLDNPIILFLILAY